MAWTITVEVSFATAPMDPSPTWTDITAYVLHKDGIGRSFGRTDEFSDVQPGILSLTLNNRDGRFTMFNTSSPYYPNVKIGRRIRVTATRSAVTYRRFDGHVNNWPTEWVSDRSTYAEAHVTATDRLQRLGAPGGLRSMVEEEILLDSPDVYYPLSEPAGAETAATVAPAQQATATIAQMGSGGTLTFGSGTGPGTDSLPAATFEHADYLNGKYLLAVMPTAIGSAQALTIECWFATDAEDHASLKLPLLTLVSASRYTSVYLEISNGTRALVGKFRMAAELTALLVDSTVTNLADGLSHHAAFTLSQSGATVTLRLYLDGVEVDSTTAGLAALSTYTRLMIGAQDVLRALVGTPPTTTDESVYSGTLSHVAVYAEALTAGQIDDHYQAGAGGWGETSDERLGRIADWIAYPTADRNFDVGVSTVGRQSTQDRQPLEAVQDVTRTEQGVAFVDPDSRLTFHNRTRRYNSSPTITLNAATGQLIGPFEIPGDDFGMVNDVTVSRPGGSPARAVNQDSIDEYGLRRDSVEVIADNDLDTQALADWRANIYGDPATRIGSVTVDLQRLESSAPSQVALLLAATIGTQIRLSNLPSQAPASTVDLFVEGWSEQFNQKHWRITFNTSPADFAKVWALGTAGFGELGTTTTLAY